jgi:hypothetical protein
VAGDRAGGQGVEEVVVGAVVAEPDHEPRRLLAVREHAPHVQPLVDASRPHLDHAMPAENLRGRTAQVVAEIVQELVRTPGAVLGLRFAVVPRDAARLPLDVRPRDVGGDSAQQPLDRPHPAQVQLDQRPPLASRRPREVAVLGAEVEGQQPEPLLELAPPPPADDVHVRRRKRRELP